MFREFLVYHNSSLEFRAKLLTLLVSANSKISPCEEKILKEIVYSIYNTDDDRAELLLDTVYEYHHKIITNNGLDFEHLIQLVDKEVRETKRFSSKIDIESLTKFLHCTDVKNEEEYLFQQRVLEFLETLKNECSI